MKTFFSWVVAHKIFSGLLIVVIAVLSYFFFFRETATVPVETQKSVTVTREDLAVAVTGSGQVAAESQVDLKPVAAGDAIEVTSVAVKNDQAVKKGQLIATIDSEDAYRDVHQAELSLKAAKIKMQQTEKEYAARNEDETLVRRAQELSVTQQELALQKSYSKLADYSIRAPFDGIVTGLDVDGGDTISQSSIVASVITKEMKAVITLNEVDAVKIHIGDQVDLSFNALPDTIVSGKIAKVDTIGTISQGVVSYGAEVALDEQLAVLRPGMSVTATIIVAEKKNVVSVPNEALSYQDGVATVRMAGSKVPNGEGGMTLGQKKEVTVGMTDNVMTEIIDGLKEGDTVIVTVGASTPRTGTQTSWLNSLFRSSGRTGTGPGSR
ncbi:MAG: efflux RND transporter periplasmic adaptor subunit [Candidatus Moranbacteria bacterium]|nr:efflux RND transporter periplasmic adaptor subunit [Candidatus Moranbacteria bacterium]